MLIATVLTAAAVVAPTTHPATNVTATGATLNGTVDGSATVPFEYEQRRATYGLATPIRRHGGGRRSAVAGLTPETKYRYRIVAGGQTGNDQTFTTTANPQPPAIANQHSREITPDAATTTATVNANGSATTYTMDGARRRATAARTPRPRPETAARPRP